MPSPVKQKATNNTHDIGGGENIVAPYLTVGLGVTGACTGSSELLRLRATGVGNEEGTVVLEVGGLDGLLSLWGSGRVQKG